MKYVKLYHQVQRRTTAGPLISYFVALCPLKKNPKKTPSSYSFINNHNLFILSLAEIYPKVYHICFFIATYCAPLCLMVLAYIQICHKLWFQQVWNSSSLCKYKGLNLLSSGTFIYICAYFVTQIPGSTSVLQRKWRSMEGPAQAPGLPEPPRIRASTACAEIKQVRARRKTARMLMVVLFVFALCYLPISVLNVMKR